MIRGSPGATTRPENGSFGGMQTSTPPSAEDSPAEPSASPLPPADEAAPVAGQPVLVIADGSEALQALLAPQHAVLVATSGAEGLELARQHHPDVVLLDLMLPDMTGFEVLRRLQIDARTAEIPVIFVASQSFASDGVRSLALGAADFVTTPLNPPVLAARVATQLRLSAYRRQVEELSQQDPATGVANRRHFDRMLAMECRRAQRSQTQVSVAMVELDAFGAYAERHGQAVAADTLRTVAQTLRTSIRRPADLAARYADDRFAVLIPDTRPGNARKVVQAFCDALAALQIPHASSGVAPRVTVSVGLATTEVGEDGEGEALVHRAEAQLQRARDTGHNRVVADSDASA